MTGTAPRLWGGGVALVLGAGLVVAMLPRPAEAHLGNVPPDLDAWLARGEAVVVAHAVGAPRPCGSAARPAVLPVEIDAVLDGAAHPGPTEVLVPARPKVDLGSVAAVVSLRDPGPGDGAGCARIPDLVLAGPRGRPPAPGAHVAAWRRYVKALRAMSVVGVAGRARLAALWARTLGGPDPVLSDHAATRLIEAADTGPLPGDVRAHLADLARDPKAPDAARAVGIRLSGDALGGGDLGTLAADPRLPVATAAVARLLDAPPVGNRAAAARAHLARALAAPPPPGARRTPADRIRHAGLAAALAGLGDDSGRGALNADLASPLFRVRDLAISGLAHLALHGDPAARAALVARRRVEPDARLKTLLDRVLARIPAPRAPTSGAAAADARRIGLRMLLVLVGLMALLAMALLPLALDRLRARRRGSQPARR